MDVLKFTADRDSRLKAVAKTGGHYLIVDYGREGWDATFTSAAGEEVAIPPIKGGRFHRGSRHAIAACQEHHRRIAEPGLPKPS